MFFEFGFGNVSINEIKKAMQRKIIVLNAEWRRAILRKFQYSVRIRENTF